jgi:hypothetical protein
MKLNINITVSIEQADLQILQDLDSAVRTSDTDMTQTGLESKLGKETVERLSDLGVLNCEFDEFLRDGLYWISDLGQRVLSSAIQSGEAYLHLETKYDPDMR